ncbi:DUF937 domain-containing protein [Zunongwangia sp. F363]|uniref:DUF937 domain-containing protein n=1 Tax=Autumnicola tepida TaxID=3075595 RepID=A0ABU3CCJ0_9FLAO|nr:DUF937 domain-containing protein [Zunongwangia sp. F363]MDT0644054.1 DUF937 domain-containing protein [Zunongwangia sp. F363]
MASILDILNTKTGDQLIGKITEKTGLDKEKATTALGMAMPMILGALKKNAEDDKGSEKLNNALEADKHNGHLLNNLSEADTDEVDNEGNKILDHILGDKRSGIESALSTTLGLEKGTIGTIIKLAAPVIMNLLGSQKRKDNVSGSGLSSLIGSVLGSSAAHDHSFVQSLLDKDDDGNVIDDVSGMILGGGKNKKKGDSILKGFTGGK